MSDVELNVNESEIVKDAAEAVVEVAVEVEEAVADVAAEVEEAVADVAAEAEEAVAEVAAETEEVVAEEAVAEAAAEAEEAVAEVAAEAAAETAAPPAEPEPAPAPEPEERMEDYSDALESSLRKIREGDVMEGEVIAFNEHGVILDLNYYATGRVPVEEMSADPAFNIMTDVQIGDRFQAVVKRVDDGKGNILLSKKAAESEYSWEKLRQMQEEEAVIEGTVSQIVRSGVIMYVEGIRGFIPASRLDVKYVEDTEPYLGRKLKVRIVEVSEDADKLILSAKEAATDAYVKEQEESISRLSIGSIITGKVESLKNYGAFVALGDGISGLLHISEISDKRISHPKTVLRVGQEVPVMITRIENGKVSLSMKAIEAAKEQEVEEEAKEYHSDYKPNNPFADLLKDFMK